MFGVNIRNILSAIPTLQYCTTFGIPNNALPYQIPVKKNDLENLLVPMSNVPIGGPPPIDLMDWWPKMPNIWYRCPKTNKPEVCPENLLKLSAMIGGTVLVCGVAGYYSFSAFGFATAGIRANSFATVWQSIIGNVPADSLFAILQSLGMTGNGAAVIGATTAGLTFLVSLVVANRLDWCTCQYDEHHKALALIQEKIKETQKGAFCLL